MDTINFNKNVNIIRSYDKFKFNQKDYEPYIKGFPFLFITTPKLNLTDDNINHDNFFMYMKAYYPDLLYTLTTSDICSNALGSPFIKILSNSFKGLSGKDVSVRTLDVGETFYGYKETLPSSILDSKLGDTVNIKFNEYKDLLIVKLHKVWIEYIEFVTRGWFTPSEAAVNDRFIDYTSSLYYFVLDKDCETILFWSRYVGATPSSNPYSSLASNQGESDIAEISIDYTYSWKDDLDPGILIDFNKVSRLNYMGLKYGEESPKSSFFNTENSYTEQYDFTEKTDFNRVEVVKSTRKSPDITQSSDIFKLKFF